MTCREKLKMEHPTYISDCFSGGCVGCPHTYDYLPKPKDCEDIRCAECWDREIPGTEPESTPLDTKPYKEAAVKMRTMYDELIAVGFSHNDAIRYLGKALELAKEATDDE